MAVAIITGASSGFGKEYVSAVIDEVPEIDEIWLIARRKEKLQEIADTYPDKKIIPIPLDLTSEDNYALLEKVLDAEKPDVMLLINNSGYGKLGDFYSSELSPQLGMTKLNVSGLTAMTSTVLPYMGDGSAIINVSSIASFAPTPGMAVYCATKSYVAFFTKALREELKPRGINALYVCPGPMNTEFNKVAGIGGGRSKRFESLPTEDPAKLASESLNAALDGKACYTGKFFYKFYRFLAKILPHSFVMKFTSL